MANPINELIDAVFKKGKKCANKMIPEPKPAKERISDRTGDVGNIDYPIDTWEKDKLYINPQVIGLTEFLRTCDTPMTIAIQGAWGAGKSSYAELIREQLTQIYGAEFETLRGNEEEYEKLLKKMGVSKTSKDSEIDVDKVREKYIDDCCPFISFNGWKFTQFNMSDQLLTNMVTSLTVQLESGIKGEGAKKKSEDILRLMNNLARMGGIVANSFIKEKTGFDFLDTANSADWKSAGADDVDYITLINKLQSNFQQLIYERLGINAENQNLPEYKNKRVIFFVDDLDRLTPDKAIDVLEVLKLFLDCKHCVFLLAIDYDVVVNGVKLKYQNTLSEDKGQDFFEKMIQVVYTIPSFLSQADEYVKEILEKNGQSVILAPEFTGLMKSGRKDNPRAIKRLLNSYLLLEKMKAGSNKKRLSTEDSIRLFSALCLQNICPEMFTFLNEKLNNTAYDYVEGRKWFTKFIRFCYDVYEDEKDAEDWDKQYELERMGLFEHGSTNRLDRTKIQFLIAFFKKIHGTQNRKAAYINSFSKDSEYEIQDIINLKSALRFSVDSSVYMQSQLGNTISFIKTGSDLNLKELKKGTSEEAYVLTVKQLLEQVAEDNVWIESNHQFGWREQARSVEQIVKELDWVLSFEPKKDWKAIVCDGKTIYLRMSPEYQKEEQCTNLELAIWRADCAKEVAKRGNVSFEWYSCINGDRHVIFEHHKIDAFFCAPPFEVSFIHFGNGNIAEIKSGTIAEAYYRTVFVCMNDLLQRYGIEKVNEVLEQMDFLCGDEDIDTINPETIADVVKDWSPEDSATGFIDGKPVYAKKAPASSEEFFSDIISGENEDFLDDFLGEAALAEEDGSFSEQEDEWFMEEELPEPEEENDIWELCESYKQNGAALAAVVDEEGQRDYYIYTDISAFQMLENLEKLNRISQTQYVWYKDANMFDEVVHGYWKNKND